MRHIYTSAAELVGKTPLLELTRLEKEHGLEATLLAKLEYFNPAGSVKDRAALSMIEEAERSGRLSPGAVIVEPTSGNTGIGLAAIAVPRGYRVVLTMPEDAPVTIAIFISGSPFSCDYFRLCTLRMDFFFCGLDEDSPLPFPVNAGFVFLCPAFEFL